MVIDYEKFTQALKGFVEACKPLFDILKKVWDAAKNLAKEYIQLLPKHPEVIHPTGKVRKYKQLRFKSQVFNRKPMMARARSYC